MMREPELFYSSLAPGEQCATFAQLLATDDRATVTIVVQRWRGADGEPLRLRLRALDLEAQIAIERDARYKDALTSEIRTDHLRYAWATLRAALVEPSLSEAQAKGLLAKNAGIVNTLVRFIWEVLSHLDPAQLPILPQDIERELRFAQDTQELRFATFGQLLALKDRAEVVVEIRRWRRADGEPQRLRLRALDLETQVNIERECRQRDPLTGETRIDQLRYATATLREAVVEPHLGQSGAAALIHHNGAIVSAIVRFVWDVLSTVDASRIGDLVAAALGDDEDDDAADHDG